MTVDNYDSWISQWVNWHKKEVGKGQYSVTDFTLKAFLDHQYKDGKYSSYMCVDAQIARFINCYQLFKV